MTLHQNLHQLLSGSSRVCTNFAIVVCTIVQLQTTKIYLIMKLLLITLLCMFTVSISGQTYIKDKQQVYGKWKLKNSPYIIKGEAIVPKGKKLKIEDGVVIKFKTGSERDYYGNENFDVAFLRVEGTLIAKGKKDNIILFTRDGNYSFWGVVYFYEGSKKNLMRYCKVEYSHFIRYIIPDDNATGAISFQASKGTVENCLIVNNGWTGLNFKNGSTPEIINTTIAYNKYGFEANSESKPTVVNSIIWQNEEDFYLNSYNRPVISYSLIPYMPELIENGGHNIIGSDPLFINPSGNDFRLQQNSPCKDAGKGGNDIGVEF